MIIIIFLLVTYILIFGTLGIASRADRRSRALYIKQYWVKADTLFNEEQWYYNPDDEMEMITESELIKMLNGN